MKPALNDTVHLTMSEITKKLFNQKFLSDVQFAIDGKFIFAHSLELMKRSTVFQQHMETTIGEKKLIPITEYKYDSFYQFIRFCYTDECTITDGIVLELLKLARNYRVTKLENKVINFNASLNHQMLLFEYGVLEKYDGLRNHLQTSISQKYSACLRSETFLKLHPDTIEQILQFNYAGTMVRELEIFEALIRWMNHYCGEHGIDLSQRRIMFNKHIQLIRFPTIRIRDLREFKTRYGDLLTKEDFMTIGSQVTFDYEIEERVWNSKMRMNFSLPVEWKSYPAKEKFETKFTVDNNYILTGIRFSNTMRGVVEIRLEESLKAAITTNSLSFNQELVSEYPVNFLNLGESFELTPSYNYTIGINFAVDSDADHEEEDELLALYRCESQTKICRDPLGGVNFSQISPNLIEIIVKLIDEGDSDVDKDEIVDDDEDEVGISEEEDVEEEESKEQDMLEIVD